LPDHQQAAAARPSGDERAAPEPPQRQGHPADDNADVAVAEIFNGIIRHIEYMSDADVAYDTACDNQVTYGEGYIRLLTEYCATTRSIRTCASGACATRSASTWTRRSKTRAALTPKWCFITEDLLRRV
jgi:hypothetical protein